MPPRRAQIVEAQGERFRFYYDVDDSTVLHITRQHGTSPEDAVRTFPDGETGEWDPDHMRFYTQTASHGLFWTRHPHDQSVIVISCFERGVD